MHSGVAEGDAAHNRQTGRTQVRAAVAGGCCCTHLRVSGLLVTLRPASYPPLQYTGEGMALAKAVQDCAYGGQVLVDFSTLAQCRTDELEQRHRIQLADMGLHEAKGQSQPLQLFAVLDRALLIPRLVQLGPVRCVLCMLVHAR